jgi:uncharacterized protein (TIGR00296 family)
MLTIEEGRSAVEFARYIIEDYVSNIAPSSSPQLSPIFSKNHGVFVTLHLASTHALRGCIGIPEPVMPLKKAIIEAAISATHDPRFPPLTPPEIKQVILELTILTPPLLIRVTQSEEYLEQITIGSDGLIVENGFYKGLLLPQVPVEYHWDVETFLSQTCMKAGLPPDTWRDVSTKIYRFQGQIFTELAPYGDVKEKRLDES